MIRSGEEGDPTELVSFNLLVSNRSCCSPRLAFSRPSRSSARKSAEASRDRRRRSSTGEADAKLCASESFAAVPVSPKQSSPRSFFRDLSTATAVSCSRARGRSGPRPPDIFPRIRTGTQSLYAHNNVSRTLSNAATMGEAVFFLMYRIISSRTSGSWVATHDST